MSQTHSNHIQLLRTGQTWEKATFAIFFAALRQFLRWSGNPIVSQPGLWKLPSGEPSHCRWLTKHQLLTLFQKAEGAEKILVGLEGLNGLRRVECLRLRAKDIFTDEGCVRVLGKGRNGGKWRTIPLHPQVRAVLAARLRDSAPEERLLPLSRSGADLVLRRAANRAGFGARRIKVSHHDLRRTFGRLAYASGMDLIQLRNLFGHSSVDLTAHYVGLDTDGMKTGLERFARSVR